MKTLAAAAIAGLVAACPVLAQEPLKVGVIAPFTGPFAEYGKQR